MKVYVCFPKGKAKALTMSYDDGKIQDERLVSILTVTAYGELLI